MPRGAGARAPGAPTFEGANIAACAPAGRSSSELQACRALEIAGGLRVSVPSARRRCGSSMTPGQIAGPGPPPIGATGLLTCLGEAELHQQRCRPPLAAPRWLPAQWRRPAPLAAPLAWPSSPPLAPSRRPALRAPPSCRRPAACRAAPMWWCRPLRTRRVAVLAALGSSLQAAQPQQPLHHMRCGVAAAARARRLLTLLLSRSVLPCRWWSSAWLPTPAAASPPSCVGEASGVQRAKCHVAAPRPPPSALSTPALDRCRSALALSCDGAPAQRHACSRRACAPPCRRRILLSACCPCIPLVPAAA